MTELDIGDIIRASLGCPLDALAAIPEQIDQQISAPSQTELSAIEELAIEASELQDELIRITGDRAQRLKNMKSELKDKMIQHGLKEISIDGRPPIELSERSSRKPTRKAIIKAMQDEHGAVDGKKKALELWNSIEPAISYGLTIPDPSPPELDSPY